MSKGQYEDRIKNWKAKAISRRKDNEGLRRRIKELTQSRDNWKNKYKSLQLDGKSSSSSDLVEGPRAKGHHYSLLLVSLVVELYKYGGMSLRSCRHSLCCMLICLGLSDKLPSHNTIRNWLCKCGYYRMKSQQRHEAPYVIYVDESIHFGSEKILLILGVPYDNIPHSRSLGHTDMEVLHIGVSKEWKAEAIAEELSNIEQTKPIEYVVSDEGNNLRKAYKILKYSHIEDCTHIFANHLKRIYEKDTDFDNFRKLIGKLRQKWNLSKNYSQYIPPTMRGKMRFANIFPSVNWTEKMLKNWERLPLEVQHQITFLKEKKAFIKSLSEVETIFKFTCEILKNKGFTATSKKKIVEQLNEMQLTEKASIFRENVEAYLDNLTGKSRNLNQEHLLCSSDIIESYFGKFKAKINPNCRSGLTEFIFTIATFGKMFSREETKKALENVKCRQLNLNKKINKAA